MPRVIPESRFRELVDAGTEVFIAHGYRRTQMADVAAALGVAKGTLYLYVESKQALFWLCAAHCDAPGPIPRPEVLPVPTPKPGALRDLIGARLAGETGLPELSRASAAPAPEDVAGELDAVLRELYATMHRNRRGLELIDVCGQDHPELSADLQRQTREQTQRRVAGYLERRAREGHLRPVPDAFLAARMLMETLTTWAVHIAWDPTPQTFDDAQVEEAILDFVRGALLWRKNP